MSGEASSTATRQVGVLASTRDIYASTSDEDEGLTNEVVRGSLSYGRPRLWYFPFGNYAVCRWKVVENSRAPCKSIAFQTQLASAKLTSALLES